MLNARLAPGPCATRLISQLGISSNIKPTSSTGMTTSAPPAYSHINAFSLQSCRCLPELAWPERRSQLCQGSTGPALLVLPRSLHATGTAGCHSPVPLLLSAGSQAHVWSLETQLRQQAQGWKKDKSQTYGIPPLFHPLIFPLAACV